MRFFAFDPHADNVVVQARLFGPRRPADIRMALDTGATLTIVRPRVLESIGYEPRTTLRQVQFVTASGTESAPIVNVARIESMGNAREVFEVMGHSLPEGTDFDGLLGLDFFRDRRLIVDFSAGRLGLT